MEEKDVVVVSHGGGCSDGFGSAVVLNAAYRGRISDFIFLEHGKNAVLEEMMEKFDGKNVVIADYALNNDDFHFLEEISKRAKSVKLLDHHTTTAEFWVKTAMKEGWICSMNDGVLKTGVGNISVIVDKNHCGASLCWATLFKDHELPVFLKYLREGDLYKFSSLESRAFSAGLGKTKKDMNEWTDMLFDQGKVAALIEKAMPEIEMYESICSDVAKTAKPSRMTLPTGEVHECMFVVCPTVLRNRVAEMIYDEKGGFVAMLTEMDDRQVKVSLRSSNQQTEPVNVRLMAESFGTGGHDTAAALRLTKDQFLNAFSIGEELVKSRGAKP